jgi:Secretion system C-terminal sorting domain
VQLNGTIVFNNFDFTAGTALDFSGSSGWGNFTVTNRLGLNRPGSTITFNAGSTIILNGLLELPNPGAVQTSVSGSAATISKSSGRICVSNVIIKDLNASGGALFYASNSTNNGNNAGWNFTSQTCLTILPVQLLSFELGCITDKILFTWKTATEINSSHFEIQKQVNNSWVTIGNVRASGESQSERTYQFQSTEQGGVYRLVSADLDGKKSYSAIRSLRCREIENISLVNNPVQNELDVQIKSIKNERMHFQIINSSGQVVRMEEVIVISGLNQHKFNLFALPSGMYILNVSSQGKKIIFVKMK